MEEGLYELITKHWLSCSKSRNVLDLKTSHLSHGDIRKHSHLCILLAFCRLFINKNLLVLDYFLEMISTLRLYNWKRLHKPSIWEIIQIFIAWVATSSPKHMLDFTGKTIYLLPVVFVPYRRSQQTLVWTATSCQISNICCVLILWWLMLAHCSVVPVSQEGVSPWH